MNSDPLERTDPATSPPQSYPSGPQEASQAPHYQQMEEATGEPLRQVAAELKESGSEALQTAKEAGNNFLDEQKEKFAAQIDRYTEAVKAACETLETTDANPLVSPAQRASHQMERAAEYLRSHNTMDFLGDLGDLARRRPEIVFGSLFVAGLASVRFLKASARHQRRPVKPSGSRMSSYPSARPYQPVGSTATRQPTLNPNLLK